MDVEELALKRLTPEEKAKIKRAIKKKKRKDRDDEPAQSEWDQMNAILILAQHIKKPSSSVDAEQVEKANPAVSKTNGMSKSTATNGAVSGIKDELFTSQDPAGSIRASSSMDVEVEEEDDYLVAGDNYAEFKHVFANFKAPTESNLDRMLVDEDDESGDSTGGKNVPDVSGAMTETALSKKKKKKLKRMQVAQLKVLVKRPDLVEAWDVTAPDPLFLIQLKSYKNTVPVPRHWCQKRKFLQSKRGVIKAPFKLPDFIEATGISKLRDPLSDRDGVRMIRQRLRERMNPKLGKIDIDYEILHDAFFVHQKKPHMTIHGDIYFEGKEDEVKMRSYKPGKLSDELRRALNITESANPPWLITMQRFGPPPSYPHLKIPGLTSFNLSDAQKQIYLQKAAEDETVGRVIHQLYGDRLNLKKEIPVNKTLWGQISNTYEDEVASEAGIENQFMGAMPTFDFSHIQPSEPTYTKPSKPEAPSFSSSGLETPSFSEIRKTAPTNVQEAVNVLIAEDEDQKVQKPLFKVLEKKESKPADSKNVLAPSTKSARRPTHSSTNSSNGIMVDSSLFFPRISPPQSALGRKDCRTP